MAVLFLTVRREIWISQRHFSFSYPLFCLFWQRDSLTLFQKLFENQFGNVLLGCWPLSLCLRPDKGKGHESHTAFWHCSLGYAGQNGSSSNTRWGSTGRWNECHESDSWVHRVSVVSCLRSTNSKIITQRLLSGYLRVTASGGSPPHESRSDRS